jgi:hypothetical protein
MTVARFAAPVCPAHVFGPAAISCQAKRSSPDDLYQRVAQVVIARS